MVAAARSSPDQAEIPAATSDRSVGRRLRVPSDPSSDRSRRSSHDDPDQRAWDAMKEEYLRANGWRMLRVKNDDIYQAFGEVEAQIVASIGD